VANSEIAPKGDLIPETAAPPDHAHREDYDARCRVATLACTVGIRGPAKPGFTGSDRRKMQTLHHTSQSVLHSGGQTSLTTGASSGGLLPDYLRAAAHQQVVVAPGNPAAPPGSPGKPPGVQAQAAC